MRSYSINKFSTIAMQYRAVNIYISIIYDSISPDSIVHSDLRLPIVRSYHPLLVLMFTCSSHLVANTVCVSCNASRL